MAKGNHSFTEQDIHSRFGAIVGHTVADVDTAGVLAASKASRNKGRIGAVIEQSVLGYPADSDRRPDIVIDGQPWEVKATGLVEGARGGWRAKEPMSITAVAPEGIVAESFTTSAFWHKAERLLVVYYLYVRPGRGVAVEYAGFEFKGYDLHTWREVDRCRLEADWTVVREFVRTALEGDIDAEMPNLSTLINPQLLYFDTSPKWPSRPRFRLKASLSKHRRLSWDCAQNRRILGRVEPADCLHVTDDDIAVVWFSDAVPECLERLDSLLDTLLEHRTRIDSKSEVAAPQAWRDAEHIVNLGNRLDVGVDVEGDHGVLVSQDRLECLDVPALANPLRRKGVAQAVKGD